MSPRHFLLRTALSGAAILLVAAAAPAGALAGTATATATAAAAAQGGKEETINAPYNAFLSKYLTEEDGIALVRYGDVTEADHQSLKDYIAALEGQAPSAMAREEQLAFWFNLYNAKTLDIVLDEYPVDSIRDIGRSLTNLGGGPWKKEVVTVEGEALSLDNIEHDTVRATFDEPRVHYAFNCASIGCPNLKASAWEAASLDEDLDAGARAYLSHPRGIRVEGNRVIASSIFDWFQEDFGGNDRGVLEHVRQYVPADKKTALEGKTRIDRHDYDWDLNEG